MDCLKTKLKASTGNKNLPVLGAAIVNIKYREDSSAVSFTVYRGPVAGTATIIDGTFLDAQGESLGTTLSLSRNTSTIVRVSNNNCQVIVQDKYGMTRFTAQNKYIDVLHNSLDYMGASTSSALQITTYNNTAAQSTENRMNLSTFTGKTFSKLILENATGDASGVTLSGDTLIAASPELTGKFTLSSTITSLRLDARNLDKYNTSDFSSGYNSLTTLSVPCIQGDIANLGALTAVTTISLKDSDVYGTFESFVEGLIDNSHANGNVTCLLTGLAVTWNGAVLPVVNNRSQFVVAISNGTATVKQEGTTIGTYNGSAWTYAN